jgi:hypothetical protein
MKVRNFAAAGLVAATAIVVPVAASAQTTQPAVVAHHMTEDSPGWNCRTMGNHRCGHPLPRWMHWKYATMAATKEECSTWNRRAIIFWTTGGTSSSIVCPDGTSFSS